MLVYTGIKFIICQLILYAFLAYGIRSRTSGVGAVFGVFWKQKLANKPFTVVGDGNQRDFLYVTDVVNAFYLAAVLNTMVKYDLGAGKPQSINKLVNYYLVRLSIFPRDRENTT